MSMAFISVPLNYVDKHKESWIFSLWLDCSAHSLFRTDFRGDTLKASVWGVKKSKSQSLHLDIVVLQEKFLQQLQDTEHINPLVP